VEDAVVGRERGPFCVGGGPGELVVRRGLDVHADGREDADDVPCARTVRTDVGYTKTTALSKQFIYLFAKSEGGCRTGIGRGGRVLGVEGVRCIRASGRGIVRQGRCTVHEDA